MAGKAFLDSNVLAYAQDKDSPDKRKISRKLIEELGRSGNGVISTQVMQEFYVAATRILAVDALAAKNVLKTFSVFEIVQVTPQLIQDAVDCSILNVLSFWDALVLVAASAGGCSTVYTEDMNAGQTVLGLKLQNPFKRS